jgi:hypothetical protein
MAAMVLALYAPGREDRISTAEAKRDRKNAKRGARGRSHREVNMRFRDEVIASYLNDEWRTPPAVHRLMDSRGECSDVAYALERLARAGKIENKHEAVMPSKGPPICVNYYRKLQKRR